QVLSVGLRAWPANGAEHRVRSASAEHRRGDPRLLEATPGHLIDRRGTHQRGGALRETTLAMAILVLLVLGGVAVSLVHGAWPALSRFKLAFIVRQVWNPVTDEYGALGAIYGTLVTSLIALVFAVPISFGIAVFLTELAPAWLKRPVGVAIELLAAVPSIIFGIWGLFVFAPLLQQH